MKTILFKTKKQAVEYIRENYADFTQSIISISDRDAVNYDTDMVNLEWSGETPAYEVVDDNGDTVAILAWWEEGDDEYELYVNNVCKGTFDNRYDAREAYDKAVEDNQYEDEPKEIRLYCNDEDIS